MGVNAINPPLSLLAQINALMCICGDAYYLVRILSFDSRPAVNWMGRSKVVFLSLFDAFGFREYFGCVFGS